MRLLVLLLLLIAAPVYAQNDVNHYDFYDGPREFTQWPMFQGLTFPIIGVFAQRVDTIDRWKAEVGVEFYFNIFVRESNPPNAAIDRPLEPQLQALRAARMPFFAPMHPGTTPHLRDDVGIGMLGVAQQDEPDSAKRDGVGNGSVACVEPDVLIARYKAWKAADPLRPIALNLTTGAADRDWNGRGIVCSGHVNDYDRYAEAADILSFDSYPNSHSGPRKQDDLTLIADGVDRLRNASQFRKPVFAILEWTTTGGSKPTSEEMRAQHFLALIHGAQGVIGFGTVVVPQGVDDNGLLNDIAQRTAVKAVIDEVKAYRVAFSQASLTPGWYPFTGLDTRAGERVDCHKSGFRDFGFLICVNPLSTAAQFDVSLLGFAAVQFSAEDPNGVYAPGQFRAIPVPADGKVFLSFAPGQTRVMKMCRAAAACPGSVPAAPPPPPPPPPASVSVSSSAVLVASDDQIEYGAPGLLPLGAYNGHKVRGAVKFTKPAGSCVAERAELEIAVSSSFFDGSTFLGVRVGPFNGVLLSDASVLPLADRFAASEVLTPYVVADVGLIGNTAGPKVIPITDTAFLEAANGAAAGASLSLALQGTTETGFPGRFFTASGTSRPILRIFCVTP